MAFTKVTGDYIDQTTLTGVGGGGISWESTAKTSSFTAVAGEGYFVDTTSTAITVILPSSPTAGDEVSIVDYAGTAATNNITITSSDNINGASNAVKIDYIRGGVSMVYVDATQGWIAYNANNETENSLRVPPFSADFLVVAGGGSGSSGYGGSPQAGGGAGGLRTSYGTTSGGGASAESSLSLTVGTDYAVTVGVGGTGPAAGNLTIGTDGSDSVFSTITSTGGGAARSWGSAGGTSNNGGSGGGASYNNMSPGSGTTNQGFAGGSMSGLAAGPGAGGGGAASVGSWNSTDMGVGGDGLNVSITGSSVGYAGGGGRVWTNVQGGGGVSASSAGNGGGGTPNTGGGGGGGNANSGSGGNGGTGVVIIRYPNIYTISETTSGGDVLSFSTATDGSDKVTTFTAGENGTIQFS